MGSIRDVLGQTPDEWNAVLDALRRRQTASWSTVWMAFHEQHAEAMPDFTCGRPVYGIMPDLVALLAEPFGRRPAVFEPAQVAAEQEFGTLCAGCGRGVIGVLEGECIRSSLAAHRPFGTPPVTSYLLAGWTDEQKRKLPALREQVNEREEEVLRTMRAQSVHLVSDVRFIEERRDLVSLADSLGIVLAFPLSRMQLTARGAKRRAMEEFSASLATLMDRWELSELTTWDLPVPCGPLDGMTVSQIARLRGPDVEVTTACPGWYPIPRSEADDAVGRLISPGSQTKSMTRVARHAEAEPYTLWFQELALRQRRPRRGYVTALVRAFCEMFSVSEHRIKQIRAEYLPAFSVETDLV